MLQNPNIVRTVKVGFSIIEEVDDSTTEVDEASSVSSSARTCPNRVTAAYSVERSAALRRILTMNTESTEV